MLSNLTFNILKIFTSDLLKYRIFQENEHELLICQIHLSGYHSNQDQNASK